MQKPKQQDIMLTAVAVRTCLVAAAAEHTAERFELQMRPGCCMVHPRIRLWTEQQVQHQEHPAPAQVESTILFSHRMAYNELSTEHDCNLAPVDWQEVV